MQQSIPDILQSVRGKQMTSLEMTQGCLARIEAFDKKGPRLNAVVCVNHDAEKQARAKDASRPSGEMAGPLQGIPLLIKDNIDAVGFPTTAGSVCLAENFPPRDAFIVRKLKQAGAIILAKANLHEFAIWGETASSILGQTLNPYDLTRTPGGSSGGTGAGVAAGYAVAGIGTDTVNSVRSPASANALVGIRPTLGLVSRAGIVPYSLTQDTAGPIACSVRDAAIVLDAIAGPDPEDPVTLKSLGKIPQTYTDALRPGSLKGRRIGILRSFFGAGPVHAPVNQIMSRVQDAMREAGAILIEVEEPIDADQLTREVSVHLYDLEPDLDSYLQKLGTDQPVHSLKEILASGRFHPGIEANIRQAVVLKRESAEYIKRLEEQGRVREKIQRLLDANSLDALMYPHQRRLVVKIGEQQVERNGVLASVTGFPSIVVPGGFSAPEETAPVGVPAGVELLGRPWDELTLISLAYGIEQALPARKDPVL